MTVIVYDAGMLIALDRGDRAAHLDHQYRLSMDLHIMTTAPVVAQVSRSTRQVHLRRVLRGCEILGFETADAHAVGELLADAGTSDVVDGHLALITSRSHALLITSDWDDMALLSAHLPRPLRMARV